MLLYRYLSIKIDVDWATLWNSLIALWFCMVHSMVNNSGSSSVGLNFLPPSNHRHWFLNFLHNLPSTLYNIYFSHQNRLSRFRENWIFNFSKFFHTFCKQNLFDLFDWYLGQIHFVGVATYPCNMNQIQVGTPRSCLSCYGLFCSRSCPSRQVDDKSHLYFENVFFFAVNLSAGVCRFTKNSCICVNGLCKSLVPSIMCDISSK